MLNDIAVEAPQWLQALATAEWYDRYSGRVENYSLPKTDAAREQLASTIGGDGRKLLLAIDTMGIPELAKLPAVRMLRQVWAEQYIEENGQIRWREVKEMPAPASLISSPYLILRRDIARSVKPLGSATRCIWQGTCNPETPHLITNTETTLATVPDDNMLKTVHQSLKDHDLLPAEHLVDKGYTDARVLADNPRDYGVTIVGPVADDPAGKRDLARVLTNQRSQSIGTNKLSSARGISKVSRGYQTPIEERRCVRGKIFRQGLYALFVAAQVHQSQARAPHHWTSIASAS